MKKWNVTYTLNKENYSVECIEGETYTDAFVNTMLKHNGAIITNIERA